MRRYVSTKGVTDNNVILSPLPNDIKGKFWCSQWSKETLTKYLTQSGYGNKSGSWFKKIGNPETEPPYWHKLGKHGLKRKIFVLRTSNQFVSMVTGLSLLTISSEN